MTIAIDFRDTELFGCDDAESEDPDVLASYFVEKESFRKFYLTKTKLAIVRARKGMGKSALLAKIAREVRGADSSAVVIQVHGADLVAQGDFSSNDPLVLINAWQQAICKRIILELGKHFRIAFSDSKTAMVEAAELSGYKGRNLIGSILDRVKLPKVIAIDNAPTPESAALLKSYAENAQGLNVWILVDDVDSTFKNTPHECLQLSTFFSAARKMVADFKGVRVRASVRTDVWTSIVRTDEALDKCEQYADDLVWSTSETKRIVTRKIWAYISRKWPENKLAAERAWETAADALLGLAFEQPMAWGSESLPPDRLVHILSAGRPRWAGQICRIAGEAAAQRRSSTIGICDIEARLNSFGKWRVDDLHREHSHQFSAIQGLVEAFAGGRSIYYTPDLLRRIWAEYVVRCGGLNMVPLLEGQPVTSALQLGHFLFKIGFISARERGTDDSISFVKYEERPDLLANVVNPDDGLRWDIHPSYRQYLRIRRGHASDSDDA